jgi:magnesium-protoporphyrin IX monomethyl ester (oxidative) cyclase
VSKDLQDPVDLADTVISTAFLDHVASSLAAQPLGVPLSFEARPELRLDQVRNVARAGGEVQIGIESLSENALRLMGKGSHVLECLRLLRWCRDAGLHCSWNILYDIPGETDEDLAEMVRLMPALHSLPAPRLCLPMQLDRFSPFFDHAAQFEIEAVRPSEAYGHVYPWSDGALRDIASMWDFRRDRSLLRRARIRRLKDEVKRWQDDAGQSMLALRRRGRVASVIEMRPGAEDRVIQLDDFDSTLYAACDDIGAFDDLVHVAALHGGGDSRTTVETEKLVISRLGRLVDERIMVEVGGRYLSLAQVVPRAAGDQAV